MVLESVGSKTKAETTAPNGPLEYHLPSPTETSQVPDTNTASRAVDTPRKNLSILDQLNIIPKNDLSYDIVLCPVTFYNIHIITIRSRCTSSSTGSAEQTNQ